MNEKIKILIVDDEPNSTTFIRKALMKKGFDVTEENDSENAKKLISQNYYDIIISDLQMPNVTGLDLLKIKNNETLFIMITGYGSVDSAVDSMKLGAYDYINKPFNLEGFILKVENAAEKIKMKKEISELKSLVVNRSSYGKIIGTSKKMQDVYEFIDKTAKVNVNVLIQGASGTGKELVARAIHDRSNRKDFPFVAVNCSAIPENLLESELFGHSKGAFTGATESQRGVFEQANNGTLFLDEIAEMPFQLQAKLLRVIENWEIKPIGSEKIKKVNVRLISATNQNIHEMIKQKSFREDLYYRISTVSLTLPSLNERIEDVPSLVNNYLKILSVKFDKKLSICPNALDVLMNHKYQGNVRELENILEQAAITVPGEIIKANHLSISKNENLLEECLNNNSGVSLKDLEKSYIKIVLLSTKGNKKKAAELLGIDRKTLYNKINEFNLSL